MLLIAIIAYKVGNIVKKEKEIKFLKAITAIEYINIYKTKLKCMHTQKHTIHIQPH